VSAAGQASVSSATLANAGPGASGTNAATAATLGHDLVASVTGTPDAAALAGFNGNAAALAALTQPGATVLGLGSFAATTSAATEGTTLTESGSITFDLNAGGSTIQEFGIGIGGTGSGAISSFQLSISEFGQTVLSQSWADIDLADITAWLADHPLVVAASDISGNYDLMVQFSMISDPAAFSFDVGVASLPEPGSLALFAPLAFGLAGLSRRRRRTLA